MKLVTALLKKEQKLFLRDTRGLLTSLFFTALVSLLLFFGLGQLEFDKIAVVPNVVWLATLFGGTLQLNRTFDYERDELVMEGLIMVPDVAGAIYLSKFIVNCLVLVLVALSATFFSCILFNYTQGFGFLIPIMLGGICMSAVGTTFSSMFMTHHKKDIMLPTLFYPLMIPIIIAVIKAIDPTTANTTPWLKLIVAFSVLYTTASYLLFEHLLED